jgi:hypothetical protein
MTQIGQVAESNPTPMNLMSSMALPFVKANATRTAPLRERLFNDFISGSFFMWTILNIITILFIGMKISVFSDIIKIFFSVKKCLERFYYSLGCL